MNILRIDSSLFAGQGVSQQLSAELVAAVAAQHQGSNVVQRDLAAEGVPHLDAAWIGALSTDTELRSAQQHEMVAQSDDYIAELQAADVLVIGAPMYNFNVPSVLKAWFDHIARAGVTFAYTDQGPKGLLSNKTAYVVTTRGGVHKDAASDTEVPFVKNFLSFIGINDVEVIYAEGLNMGNGARDKGLAEARKSIQDILAA
jgi:FMN-dependent NADH-azoreductase